MGNEHLQSLEAQYLSKTIENNAATIAKMGELLVEYREALASFMLRIEKRITLLEVRASILWGLLGLGAGSGGTMLLKALGEKFASGG